MRCWNQSPQILKDTSIWMLFYSSLKCEGTIRLWYAKSVITVESLAHSESLTGSYQRRTFRAFYQLSLPPSPPLSFSSPSPSLPTLPIHHDSVSLAQRTWIPGSEFMKPKQLEHSREFSWSWGMFSIPARERKKSTMLEGWGWVTHPQLLPH